MARKRPSLRNYLIDGDQARDVLPVIDPPPSQDGTSQVDFADCIFAACPIGKLDPSTWAVAVTSHLMELKQEVPSLSVLRGAFPMPKDEEMDSILEKAVSLNVIFLDSDGVVHLNSPSSWGSICDPVRSWSDDLAAMMVEDDKNMWIPLLSQSSLAPLVLDTIKRSFDRADTVSNQFFMMRRAGEALLPITRQSQIRLPLVAVIKWSEKGDSTVFFGDTP